jgi:cystathionine gamma-synthase
MEYQTPPPLGHAIPTLKDHAISVQFPSWDDVAGYGAGSLEVIQTLQNGYPRTFLHIYVREVSIYTPSVPEPDFIPRIT